MAAANGAVVADDSRQVVGGYIRHTIWSKTNVINMQHSFVLYIKLIYLYANMRSYLIL